MSRDHAAHPDGGTDAHRLSILFDPNARSVGYAAFAPAGDCITSALRTLADLEHAVRALCFHFNTDAVVIVGSQAILAIWPEAPALLRRSGEIDAYPANARAWEAMNPGMEASEEVFALFGEASPFHLAHGFYIDGVDDTTAKLPKDWTSRQNRLAIPNGAATVYAITPELHDLAVSKLCRLEEKDRDYVSELMAGGALKKSTLYERLESLEMLEDVRQRAAEFVRTLPGPG